MLAPSIGWKAFGLLVLGAGTAFAGAIATDSPSSFTSATTTSDASSTITSPPSLEDGIAINTCSYFNSTENRTLWDDPWCSMYAGTVDLVFWPTVGNLSYPSTLLDTVVDYTYSSPSVYMVINTLFGWNPCGLLGPSTSREIFAFDLDEVSTLAPYTDETATYRRTARQLHLSDLGTSCTREFNRSDLATQLHPIKGDDTRCNPFLVVPLKVKRYGFPYWLHCGIRNNKLGLFDPPYAVPALDALVPITGTTVNPVQTDRSSAAESASTRATAISGQAPTTAEHSTSQTTEDVSDPEASVHESKSTRTAVADPGNTNTAVDNTPPGDNTTPEDSTTPGGNTTPGDNNAPGGSITPGGNTTPGDNNAPGGSITPGDNIGSGGNTTPGDNNASGGNTTPGGNDAPGHSSVPGGNAVPGDNTNPAAPGVSSPGRPGHLQPGSGESPQSPSDPSLDQDLPATVPAGVDPNAYSDGVVKTLAGTQIVSLGTAGLEVIDIDAGKTSTYAVPAAGFSQDVSSYIPATVAVYNSATLTLNGPAVTLTGAIVVSPSPKQSDATGTESAGAESSLAIGQAPTVTPSSATRTTSQMHCFVLALFVSLLI